MQSLQDAVDEAAERAGFSGVVRLDRSGETDLSAAYGVAVLVFPSGVLLVSLVVVRMLGGPFRAMRPYVDLFFMGAAFSCWRPRASRRSHCSSARPGS